MTDSNFWKRKLAAYLHDPPSKCLDIRNHGDRSDAAFRQAGFVDSEIGDYYKHADHTGAAADRLPFPASHSSGLSCAFDGVRNAFHHPLSGCLLPFHAEFRSVEQGIEGEGDVQPKLKDEPEAEDQLWRARFFAHWRLWPAFAASKDYRMALLPADTRIPDHSIWTHMQVVSALAGCVNAEGAWRPAFLKFQLGPVQDFIAAARSIRDLWSGSYLLSWLMAAGMKALSARIGPDAVVYPNLRGQPLFDLHWRRDLWDQVSINGQQPVWDSLGCDPSKGWLVTDLLTPSLPNVFLAVVPAAESGALAEEVVRAIQEEWKNIGRHVWEACERAGLTADEGQFTSDLRKQRFDAQVERFFSLSWQVTPWPDSLETSLELSRGFADGMSISEARTRVQAIVDMAEKRMPMAHRDGRFYTDSSKTKLNNIGLGWSVILGLNGWQLDAVRQTRTFGGNSGGWQVGTFSNKDALTGRDEAVAGGRTWADRAKKAGAPWLSLFKHDDDWLSAATLIKRVWHRAYLAMEPWNLKTDASHFPMPNTRGVAAHEPERDCGDDETAADAPPSEKYFAVLALDGDEIGKWISGEKTPPFSRLLADYTDGSGNPGFGSKSYFSRSEFAGFVETRRPVSPSYHLQFSEALSNFALLCARPVVEAFDGRLIYAGGDDVLALLPADTALECAQALRMAFRGSATHKSTLQSAAGALRDRHFEAQCMAPDAVSAPYCQKLAAADGFVRRLDLVDQQKRPIPFLVPGPAADCSVGIAIAHFKDPLQDVVREAQAAEKRAKTVLDRSAIAVTLMKRSGETIQWGCRWDSGGLDVYDAMLRAVADGGISNKFPHRVAELLERYCTQTAPLAARSLQSVADFPVTQIALCEFRHALDRQAQDEGADSFAALAAVAHDAPDGQQAGRLAAYLEGIQAAAKIRLEQARQHLPEAEQRRLEATLVESPISALIGLCQIVAFIARNLPMTNPHLQSRSEMTSRAERQPSS